MFKRVILMLGAIAMMLLASCAKAPEEAIQKATAALESARTAEADIYAPDVFKMASDTLAAAHTAKQEADGKFALTRSYAAATALYASAELLANKAIETASVKKTEVQNDANIMAATVKANLETLKVELDKIKVTSLNKANVESAKLNLTAAESTFAECQKAIDAGQFSTAMTKLNQLAVDIPAILTSAKGTKEMEKAGNPIVVIQTNMGEITLEVFEKETPIHGKNFLDRVDKGLYNGIIFHRVIPKFVIQGGDPTGTGYGAPNETSIPDEKSPYSNTRGFVSMARGQGASPSQFFINIGDNSRLDAQKFSVFAKVISGMDVVDQISQVPRDSKDKPNSPVTMIKVFRKK